MTKSTLQVKRKRTKFPSLQVYGLIIIGLFTAFVLCGLAVVLSMGNLENSVAVSAPAPLRQQLPSHTLATVMIDPFTTQPPKDDKALWLLIVVDDWRAFSESKAQVLIAHYEAQYSDAHSLFMDFLCDREYASEEAFVRALDTDYNPHVLFSYLRFRKKPNGEQPPPRLLTPAEMPSYGTACK